MKRGIFNKIPKLTNIDKCFLLPIRTWKGLEQLLEGVGGCWKLFPCFEFEKPSRNLFSPRIRLQMKDSEDSKTLRPEDVFLLGFFPLFKLQMMRLDGATERGMTTGAGNYNSSISPPPHPHLKCSTLETQPN